MLGEVRLTATGLVLSVALAVWWELRRQRRGEPPPPLSAKALAGQALFFDTSLSGFDPKPHGLQRTGAMRAGGRVIPRTPRKNLL